MKNKNIVATLAAIAISATSLMAHQLAYTTPETEALQEINAIVQSGVTEQAAQQQQQNDADIATKYATLTADYLRFTEFLKDTSLKGKPGEVVGQTAFMRIDDLAQSIRNLPQPTRDVYTLVFQDLTHRFAYKENKKVTLEDLFNIATSLKTVYFVENTAIAKLLEEEIDEDVISNWTPTELDTTFMNIVKEKTFDNLSAEYNTQRANLATLLKSKSLKNQRENIVVQQVFMAIDDLARAILNFPAEEQTEKIQTVTSTIYSFAYLGDKGEEMTLQDLFDFTKDYVYEHGSSIEKVLLKSNEINNRQAAKSTQAEETSWWRSLIEVFSHEK